MHLPSIEVPLRVEDKRLDPRTGAPVPAPRLTFELKPHGMSQPRLRPLMAEPTLDLSAYRARAHMDWLRLGITTRDRTQSRWISERLAKELPRGPHVRGPDGEIGHTGDAFQLQIQDPTPSQVGRAVEIIRDERGLAGPVSIKGMEIALDFYPVDRSDEARWLMVELLGKTLVPPPELLREDEHRARWYHQYWTRGIPKDSARFFVYAEEPVSIIEGREVPAVLDPEAHHKAPIDRTRWFGRKGCGRMIRVQNKTTDAKRPDKGEHGEPLAQHEKRARVEVELLAPFDEKLKLVELEDLRRLKFQDLRKSHFNFWLPTFDASGPELKRRAKIFARTGNYGLARYEAAHREVWPERWGPARASGDRIVYRKLHDMTRDALRKLNRSWGGEW